MEFSIIKEKVTREILLEFTSESKSRVKNPLQNNPDEKKVQFWKSRVRKIGKSSRVLDFEFCTLEIKYHEWIKITSEKIRIKSQAFAQNWKINIRNSLVLNLNESSRVTKITYFWSTGKNDVKMIQTSEESKTCQMSQIEPNWVKMSQNESNE